MKATRYIQNVIPQPEYTTIQEPTTIYTKEPTSREELRITRTQRQDEDAPRVDIRYWTTHNDGKETAHRGGLRLTYQEAAALRDALNAMTDL